MTRREFNATGRFAYNLDAMCKCGHTHGEHLAIRSKNQACTVCQCACFEKERKR